jgi:hypothetical protein
MKSPLRSVCLLVLFAFANNVAASQTILMVDDHVIHTRPGIERVLHQPVPSKANPVIAETKPWESSIGYCSVHHDSQTGRYQLWYQAYAGSRAKDPTRRCVVAYAESKDGLNWDKPNLGLFDFNGAADTNIVLVGNGGRSVNYGASVLFDLHDPDSSRRYKLAYWDFTRREGEEYPGLCVAFSPDGIRWTKHAEAPLLNGSYGRPEPTPLDSDSTKKKWNIPNSISDVIDVFFDQPRRKYVIYAKTWINGPSGDMYWKRAVVRTESEDFIRWTQPQLVVAPDDKEVAQGGEASKIEIHGGPTFYYAGVYFSLLQMLDFGAGGTMPGELAISRDGLDWKRPFRGNYFLPVTGSRKEFDAGCLWTNSSPVFLDDEIRFYYGAYPDWDSDVDQAKSGIGMRSLRRDRFAGLRPTDKVGQVTLDPIEFGRESELTINADVQGSLKVEVLTAQGYRIAGFTKQDSVLITGDSLQHTLRWNQRTLGDLRKGRYQLRIYLEDAELFALTIENSNER